MRFRALSICIFLIIFNFSLYMMDELGFVQPPVSGQTSLGEKQFEFHLDKSSFKILFYAIIGMFTASTLFYTITRSYVPSVITVFSGIFWGSFISAFPAIEGILKLMQMSVFSLPIFGIVTILFIIGVLELVGGGFGAYE